MAEARLRWRAGWCVIGDQVSWFEFALADDARRYFEAICHAKESESDDTLKRAWLQYRRGNGDWVLVDGPLPIPSALRGSRTTTGLGALAAVLDALGRGKAVVPTSGGVLIELDAEAYTFALSGTATMVCDADDVAALQRLVDEEN